MRIGAAVQAQGSAAVQWLRKGSAQGSNGTEKSSCRQRCRTGDGGTGGYGHWCGSGRRQRRLLRTRARLGEGEEN